jgi:hypothetical protein
MSALVAGPPVSPVIRARWAAGILYATLHTGLDQAGRDAFATAYAATAYPAPGAYRRAAR